MAGSSLVESLFQRSLDDLIKSLRSHPAGEPALISRSLDEIRREIRSTDPDTKSIALQKLSYLSSLHSLDISWASFHALELLPSSSFPHKSTAYLAASLSLSPSSDLLLLITNQLRKDLSPLSSPEPLLSLALHFLSLSASPDLALSLSPDLHSLLSSPKPHIRKKATVAALRVFTLCPDSVRVSFKRLVDNLDSSSDPRVLSAAISVFCELTNSDPKSYLPLAVEFYRILVDSKNNWVLIKVLKIFARLAPLEPRLAKRVVDPICEHMRKSVAKSLVFECVRTVFLSFSDYEHALRLAVEKVRDDFLASEDDPNLRYLGLHALSMLGPRHSWAVEENREVVIKSLSDPDPNIKREALNLIMGMVFESNVIEISMLMANYALKSDPEFCNDIIGAVLSACGRNVYELIVDFDWYVSLLGEMARNPHCEKGEEIERQLVDIGLRVKDARSELIHVARDLLIDPALVGNPFLYRILSAAAWVSGEYVEFSRNPLELVEALLQPRTNLLPMSVRAVYIQAVFKVLVFCFNSYIERVEADQFSSLGKSISERECLEESDFIGLETANRRTDDNSGTEREDGVVITKKPTSLVGSLEKMEPFTREYIMYILNLVETAVTSLSECDEVEVQERACNVLGLIHILKGLQVLNTEEGGFREDNRVVEFVKLMHAAFSDELGPVSAKAQERVSVPDGIILKENLSDVATILGDDDVTPSVLTSFSLRSHRHELTQEESSPSVESTSLLAEHRKRHGLYYLPTGRDETESNDYPRANDSQLLVSHDNASENLERLTEESLVPRKSKHTKPRPVVVKLDDGDGLLVSALEPLKDSKDDLLSGAVRDVLLGNEGKAESPQKKSSEKSSRRRVKDISVNSESTSGSRENLNLGGVELGSSSSRSSRHRSHGKERHRSPSKNEATEKEKSDRNLTSSSHNHGRRKHRQKRDVPLNVVPQAPVVIQDFLL